MNKMREYERGREDGLDLALRIVKQGGIEALEKEIKFRNITGVHTSLATKDLDKASQKIKQMTLDTFTILGIAVLHDTFGFGQIRCQRFMDGMDNSAPYLGMMASEGGQREEALIEHGCNYYGKTVIRSAPFAIFMRQDILTLALEMEQWYHDHLEYFEKKFHEQPYGRNKDGSLKEYVPVDSIIPIIYGEIQEDDLGILRTTGAQRTGCEMCGFGIHLEKRPHRFDRLRERNPKAWEFWMYRCCTDPKTGEKYGWGRVLDYIGVEWEDIPPVQMTIFDYPELLPEEKQAWRR
nr:hypothetical protein [Blautia sp. MSJ-19]